MLLHLPTLIYAGVLIICLAAYPQEANAYSDLGAASYLLQIALGCLFGFGMGIKLFFKDLKLTLVTRLGKKPEKPN